MKYRTLAMTVFLASVLAGCSTYTSPLSFLHSDSSLVHVVRYRGETLSLISHWYTGKAENWPRIVSANPSVDPKRLVPGTKIRVPNRLVVRTTPLRRSNVVAINSKGTSVSKGKPGSSTNIPSASVANAPIDTDLSVPLTDPLDAPDEQPSSTSLASAEMVSMPHSVRARPQAKYEERRRIVIDQLMDE